jgi:putative endonuclease
MYYVYVIQNEKGATYTGYSSDLRTRIKAHNEGLNASTRGHRWEVVYYEAYKAEKDARRRERQLKQSGQARRWVKERIRESLQDSRND